MKGYRRRHHVRSIPIEKFGEALISSHEQIVEDEARDLDEMTVGQPLADPAVYHRRRPFDRMASSFIGAASVFGEDRELGVACAARVLHLMKLVTKRCFRRYRVPGDESGQIQVHEAFVSAVCGMRLTDGMLGWRPRQRRRLKRALQREVRRRALKLRAEAG